MFSRCDFIFVNKTFDLIMFSFKLHKIGSTNNMVLFYSFYIRKYVIIITTTMEIILRRYLDGRIFMLDPS